MDLAAYLFNVQNIFYATLDNSVNILPIISY